MTWRLLLLTALALATLGSALAVVWSQHQTRLLFKQLSGLENARDELNHEWRQLQLEIGANAGHARVERIAREQLGMQQPTIGDIRSLRL